MNSATFTLSELAVSSSVSFAVSQSANFDTLTTALITFGVSLITIAGGELIKVIVSFLQSKKRKFDQENIIEKKPKKKTEKEKEEEKKDG